MLIYPGCVCFRSNYHLEVVVSVTIHQLEGLSNVFRASFVVVIFKECHCFVIHPEVYLLRSFALFKIYSFQYRDFLSSNEDCLANY